MYKTNGGKRSLNSLNTRNEYKISICYPFGYVRDYGNSMMNSRPKSITK
jgi:hypothetical protein